MNISAPVTTPPRDKKHTLLRAMYRHRFFYLLIAPGFLYYIIFKYVPMAGIIIAFKEVLPFDGIPEMLSAKFVGLKFFREFTGSMFFWRIFGNSALISLYNLLFGFPAPILFAVLINEIANRPYKKIVQTISYMPHFLSMIIVAGIVFNVLSTNGGFVNRIYQLLGGTPTFFLGQTRYFRSILVSTAIWQEVGWGSIVYIAAITGIDPELYEAATMDGAGRFRKIIHITLPGILPIAVLMFIMAMGRILDAGFERVLMLYSPTVYDVGDIIDTYVYRVGVNNLRYSFATAVGLFKSVISLFMVTTVNQLAKKLGQESLW